MTQALVDYLLKKQKIPRRAPVDWDSEPELGQTYDIVLANKYGVSVKTVASARRVRGIPGFGRHK